MLLTAKMGPNGFGNELVKLAKLLVCRKTLGIPIAPSYWHSPYRHALPRELIYTNRIQRALRLLTERPIVFGRDEHLATGCVPVEEALAAFMQSRGVRNEDNCCIEFKDFEPGIETVEKHGAYLYQVLMSSPRISAQVYETLYKLDADKVHIGVHIRRGDFRPALPIGTSWPAGQWNLQIPIEWYDMICERVQNAFPGRVQFLVATSGSTPEVEALCDKYETVLARADITRSGFDVADMLTLAGCDALIGSASWFTGWPVVLNPKPWIWYGCAHGIPPWARQKASLYVNEPSLPVPFLKAIEEILQRKGCSK